MFSSTTAAETVKRRPRGSALLLTATATLSTLVLALLLLSVPRQPPPTIAEIAPQAVEQIVEAPPEQSSDVGSAGHGAITDDGAGPGASAAPTKTAPRLRRCVGNPPRQTEDPQSPPCIAFWEGDNGGATSVGVTADEIRVAVPFDNNAVQQLGALRGRLLAAYQAYFNERYELYGRRLVFVDTSQDHIGNPSVDQEQAAATRAATLEVFASSSSEAYAGYPYARALAREGIVSAGHSHFSESELAAEHPFMWQYPASFERLLQYLGSFSCARLARKPALHAGDAQMRSRTRKLALLMDGEAASLNVDVLVSQVKNCGGGEVQVERVTAESGNGNPSALALKLSNGDNTTVICLCNTLAIPIYQTATISALYRPEWVLSSFILNDLAWTTKLFPEQDVFGITILPRQHLAAEDVSIQALNEVDPGPWNQAQIDRSANRQQVIGSLYRDLLILVAGMQLAGPKLTADSFARGLQQASFPNPETALHAGYAGFGPGHTMTIDAAEFWWNATAPSYYSGDGTGRHCYVDGGVRRRVNNWPSAGDPFFAGGC